VNVNTTHATTGATALRKGFRKRPPVQKKQPHGLPFNVEFGLLILDDPKRHPKQVLSLEKIVSIVAV